LISTSKNIFIAYFSRGWSVLLSLLFTPLYIKIIGIEGFAVIGIAISIHAMSYILDLGMGGAVTIETATLSARKEYPQLWNLFRTGEILYWAIALLLFGLFLASSGWIAKTWFHQIEQNTLMLDRILLLIGTALICYWPYTFYSGALLGLQRQDLVNKINLVASTFKSGFSLFLLLWVSPTVEAFLFAYLVSGLLQTLCSAIALWSLTKEGFKKGRFHFSLLGKVGKKAVRLSVIGVLGVLILNVDKIVLSHFLSIRDLGYYCFSWTLVTGVLNLSAILVMIFGPRFSHFIALNQEKELIFTYHLACQWMSLLILSVSVLLLFFSREVLLLWTGDHSVVENAYFSTSVLVLGACLNSLYSIAQSFQMANNRTLLTTLMQSAVLMICIPALALAAHFGGLEGAVLVWPILQLGYLVIYIYAMHRKLIVQEKKKWLLQDILLPASGAVAACGLCRLCLSPFLHGFTGILLLVFIAILTMLAAGFMSSILRCELRERLSNFSILLKKFKYRKMKGN
jgi:O-antigen/teichoic acid export membrane protein